MQSWKIHTQQAHKLTVNKKSVICKVSGFFILMLEVKKKKKNPLRGEQSTPSQGNQLDERISVLSL